MQLTRVRAVLSAVVGVVAMVAGPALAATTSTSSLEELVVLPERYGGPLPTQDHLPHPSLRDFMAELVPGIDGAIEHSVALRPTDPVASEALLRTHGISLVGGVRFATEADARAVWSALRRADAGPGRRMDIAGLGGVHALETPVELPDSVELDHASAFVEFYRLVGRDLYALPIVGDDLDEVHATGRAVLTWHAARFPNGIEPVEQRSWWPWIVGVAAAVGVLLGGRWLRRRRRPGPNAPRGLGTQGFSAG